MKKSKLVKNFKHNQIKTAKEHRGRIPVLQRRVPKNAALVITNKKNDLSGIEADPDVEENLITIMLKQVLRLGSKQNTYVFVPTQAMKDHCDNGSGQRSDGRKVEFHFIIDETLTNPVVINDQTQELATKRVHKVMKELAEVSK